MARDRFASSNAQRRVREEERTDPHNVHRSREKGAIKAALEREKQPPRSKQSVEQFLAAGNEITTVEPGEAATYDPFSRNKRLAKADRKWNKKGRKQPC